MSCSKGMSKGAEEEERKLRECMLRQAKAHWWRMQATFLDMTDREAAARAGTAAEKGDVRSGRQYGHYVYKCVTCVAKEANCSIDDAARMIKQPRREKNNRMIWPAASSSNFQPSIFKLAFVCSIGV